MKRKVHEQRKAESDPEPFMKAESGEVLSVGNRKCDEERCIEDKVEFGASRETTPSIDFSQ